MDTSTCEYSGNMETNNYEYDGSYEGGGVGDFIKTHKIAVMIAAGVTVVVIILIILVAVGWSRKPTSATSTSKFVPTSLVGQKTQQSNFGNYPNWYMQDGCAGYNCNVDTGSGKSLGFGISNFQQNKSNLATSPEAQRQAAEELLKKQQHMEAHRQEHMRQQHAAHQEHMRQQHAAHQEHMRQRREHMTAEEIRQQEEQMKSYAAARTNDEVGTRQARVLSACNNPWDPMATEEAKVLGAVGTFKQNTPGMSSFNRAVNENIPLTDAQLEAIMQGGEPYTIAPAGTHDIDELAAQQRQQQIMNPTRKYT